MRESTLPVTEKRSHLRSQPAAVDLATLRAGETRYRELIDHLQSGVVVYEATAGGADFIIRDFNPAAGRLEKTAPQAVIGRLVTEAFPAVAEFGLLDVLRRVWQTGRAEHHPTSLYQDERLASWRENYVYRLPSGEVVAVYDDVTERKQAEELLAKYALLAAEARDIMLFVRAADGAIVEANAAAEAAYGYSREELLRLDIDALRPASEGAALDEQIRAAGTTGVLLETEHRRKDGSTFPVEASVRGAVLVDGEEVRLSVVRDISERKRDERELRQSEEKFAAAFHASPDLMAITRMSDGMILEANEAYSRLLGYSSAESIGRTTPELSIWADPADRATFIAALEASGGVTDCEATLRRRDGTLLTCIDSARTLDVGGERCLLTVIHDVTERKRREQDLRESEARFRRVFEESAIGIVTVGPDFHFLSANEAFCRMLGYEEEELCSLTFAEITHPAHRDEDVKAVKRVVAGSLPIYRTEKRYLHKDGSVVWGAATVTAVRDTEGRLLHFLTMVEDITARKQAEEALAERSHFLEQLLEAIPVPVFYKDTDLRYLGCNDAFAALVNRSKDEIIGKTVLNVYPGAAGEQNAAADREALADNGRRLTYELQVPGADGEQLVVTTHKAAFSDIAGKPAGIVGVDLDLTQMRRAETEIAEGAVQLKLTLKAAVAALGSTTEMRDPYTAGHQRRVAELSCAIAAELGWDEAQIETLRTAALLHDIGKIVVPAEILSKPGLLTEIEMSLVRQHAGTGAQTVAAIDFEGAIAEMIRQHHERLDGSGYPAGLKDGEILPEARILAVADVVEAMISHRPYRPALPLGEALSEIEGGAGVRYDAEAAAACVRLFREKGFTLGE